jgi:hypothetical protein
VLAGVEADDKDEWLPPRNAAALRLGSGLSPAGAGACAALGAALELEDRADGAFTGRVIISTVALPFACSKPSTQNRGEPRTEIVTDGKD